MWFVAVPVSTRQPFQITAQDLVQDARNESQYRLPAMSSSTQLKHLIPDCPIGPFASNFKYNALLKPSSFSHKPTAAHVPIKKRCPTLTLAGPCIITQFKQINQPDATVLQVYHLTFCFAQHVSGASTSIIRSLQLH